MVVWPDSEGEGPGAYELADRVCDALADISDDRLVDAASRWVRIEEFSDYSRYGIRRVEGELLPLLTKLVGLAHRARSAEERLYCWICE